MDDARDARRADIDLFAVFMGADEYGVFVFRAFLSADVANYDIFGSHLTSFVKNSGVFYLVFRRFEMIYVKREVSRKKKKCEK